MRQIQDLSFTGYPNKVKKLVEEAFSTGRRVSTRCGNGCKITVHPSEPNVRIVVQEVGRPKMDFVYTPGGFVSGRVFSSSFYCKKKLFSYKIGV